jgi:hypothetical protein
MQHHAVLKGINNVNMNGRKYKAVHPGMKCGIQQLRLWFEDLNSNKNICISRL